MEFIGMIWRKGSINVVDSQSDDWLNTQKHSSRNFIVEICNSNQAKHIGKHKAGQRKKKHIWVGENWEECFTACVDCACKGITLVSAQVGFNCYAY